jgi:hypothetical protein
MRAIKVHEVKSTPLYEMLSSIVFDSMSYYYTNETSVLYSLMNSRHVLRLGLSSDK